MISAIYQAFQALAANKLRSLLTMIGTIIGVTCVVALFNIGESGRLYMANAVSSMGENALFVQARYNRDEEEQRRFHYRPLRVSDVVAVRNECPSVKEATPILYGGGKAVYGPRFRHVQVHGCFPSYLDIGRWKIESGISFSDADVRASSPVALLGYSVARELFGNSDPVGQKIRLDHQTFLVIGVLKKKGSFFGDDQDNRILAPFTTLADHMGWGRNVHMIMVSCKSRQLVAQAKKEIQFAIRQSQKLPLDRKDPVEIHDMGQIADTVDSVLLGIAALLAAIGGISLLVGGVGIMNIMLVSVTERTREIGLRLAVGASDFDILMQFLIEAVVLSGVGGLIGTAVGAGVATGTVKIISLATKHEWPAVISPLSLAVAFFFATGVGVVFGFYPAWSASRLDPIVALRRE